MSDEIPVKGLIEALPQSKRYPKVYTIGNVHGDLKPIDVVNRCHVCGSAIPRKITSVHQPVAELGLSRRLEDCFMSHRITLVSDLLEKTERDLLRSPNFGRKSLADVEAMLSEAGLRLKEYIPEFWKSSPDAWRRHKELKEEARNLEISQGRKEVC